MYRERMPIHSFFKKARAKWRVILFDAALIPVAWFGAYWLRYNLESLPHRLWTVHAVMMLGCVITVQLGCYYYFKVYRGLWRFASLNDVTRILRAILACVMVLLPLFYALSWLQEVPRSVFPLYALLLATTLCCGRLFLRHYWEGRDKILPAMQRVLIIGAGQAGEGLVRDLKRSARYQPIGFLDDCVSKRGLEVHGVRVLGTIDTLQQWASKLQADLIFIAIPTAGSQTMRHIVAHCEACGIPFRTLPGLSAIASGQVEINALRKVSLDDLLGRDQVHIEWDKVDAALADKRVIVTGGGGSIGSELCRQIAVLRPEKLMVLDQNEFNLYAIEQELHERFPSVAIEIVLANVCDDTTIEPLFKRFKPHMVFHAAAYKHVPMLESHIRVAVKNNVFGTQVVAQASVAVGVEKFILISTDKAVNPTNVMGTTKRVAEIFCQNWNALVSTQFITVRFGNVLGSAGSVVPLFQRQLEQGGPLTVTHPEVQRYFMTIPEASQLILQAMANGRGGEIFVLDMGQPVKISYLAEQLIRLAGKIPGEEIAIEYVGLRPGEKLFEELFHASEQLAETAHEKLFQARFRQMDWSELMQTLRMMKEAYRTHQETELLVLLKSIVPEFKTHHLACETSEKEVIF